MGLGRVGVVYVGVAKMGVVSGRGRGSPPGPRPLSPCPTEPGDGTRGSSGGERSRDPAALAALAALPLPARRVSLSPVLPARVADPRPHRETGQAALVLSQFVLSGVFICQRYSGGARGGGGSRGQSRPCRHAAATGGSGDRGGSTAGAAGVLQAQRVGGRVAAPGQGSLCPPPGIPGRRGGLRDGPRSVPRGPACGPAHARVSRGAPRRPPSAARRAAEGGCPASLGIPGGGRRRRGTD